MTVTNGTNGMRKAADHPEGPVSSDLVASVEEFTSNGTQALRVKGAEVLDYGWSQ